MTRTLISATLLALLANTVAASPPTSPTEDTSYRTMTMTTDALLLASALGGAMRQSRGDGAALQPWFTVSAATSVLGVPIIHGLMGHRERSPGSAGLRLGLALAGGYVAYRLNDDCDDGLVCQTNNVDYGILAGLAAGAVLDAVWISSPSRERKEPQRLIAPQLAATRDGAVVGLGGIF